MTGIQLVELTLRAFETWLAMGLLFGVAFVWRGVQRLDPTANGSGPGFRLLLLPGCMILWPRLAWLWVRGRGLPIESSAHRRAAAGN